MWILGGDNMTTLFQFEWRIETLAFMYKLWRTVKFEFLSWCMWCVSMIWIGSGCYFHLQDHSFMQILSRSSVTNSACSPASPFCMVKLHYQDNSHYPTTLTVLPLGSPLDFVTACLALSRTPALGVLDVLLHPSDSLPQQLKSFVPAEENGSIHPETSHQHP